MTVKPLLNENFPAPATARLREAGFDLLAIGQTAPGSSDEHVLALAVAQGRWIVTFDRDYGELIFGRRLPPPPAVFLLREPHYRPAEPADWIIELLLDEQRFAGQLVIFTRRSVRTRPPPALGAG